MGVPFLYAFDDGSSLRKYKHQSFFTTMYGFLTKNSVRYILMQYICIIRRAKEEVRVKGKDTRKLLQNGFRYI
jgi:hypothetical protein